MFHVEHYLFATYQMFRMEHSLFVVGGGILVYSKESAEDFTRVLRVSQYDTLFYVPRGT
nr:hypothetical protein [Mucilaginibacter sp. X4EP1]